MLSVLGNTYYLVCEYVGLLFAYVFMLLGWWKPEEHLRNKGLAGYADRANGVR